MPKIYNLDIRPTDETCSLYPSIRPLLRNDTLEAAFDTFEAVANSAKQRYHFWGRIAIWLIATGSIHVIAEALVLPEYEYADYLALVTALLVGAGVGLQVWLVLSRLKQRWLLNRFGAERLRSIKFQAFTLANSAPNTTALASAVEKYYSDAITRLNNELREGAQVLGRFSPKKALALGAENTQPVDATLAAEARQAYLDMRVEFQALFAGGEVERLEGREHVINSTADIIYLTGATLVALALVVRVFHVGSDTLHHGIDFTAVVLFIISLSMAVLEHASIDIESQSRYELYEAHMDGIHDHATSPHAASTLGSLVQQAELAALGELAEFCRSAARITYRV